MRLRTPPHLPDRDEQTLSVCEKHLEREEALLAELLATLRQVRDAFLQRDLTILPTLRDRQENLARTSEEITQARDQLRESLAPLLGISAAEVTLRAAAASLQSEARERLLSRHARLTEMVRESDQLSRHNAALLGYARGFLDCLFARLTGGGGAERYDPRGERRALSHGSFLEARA